MSSGCACSPVWSPLGLVVVWNLGGDETAGGTCGGAGYKEESFGWWCAKTDDPEFLVYHLSSWLLGEGKGGCCHIHSNRKCISEHFWVLNAGLWGKRRNQKPGKADGSKNQTRKCLDVWRTEKRMSWMSSTSVTSAACTRRARADHYRPGMDAVELRSILCECRWEYMQKL